jgi:hypothetical protein
MDRYLDASFWSDDRPVTSDRESLEWAAQFSPSAEAKLRQLQQAEAAARRDRESLEWAACFSSRAEEQLRRVRQAEAAAEAEARRDRERLEWTAQFSERHERRLRALLEQEAAQRQSQERRWRPIEEGYDEADHPRLPKGSPGGGQWVAKAGGGGSPGSSAPVKVQAAPVPTVVTKQQLPADRRGAWISGTKGNGTFRYNDSPENRKANLAGKEFRFENEHIAVGGFPAEAYYGGNAAAVTVEIPRVTGSEADNVAADAAMRAKLGDPHWQRPKGYRWNHAGGPGSKKLELVDASVHSPLSHKGPGAEPRALARIAKKGGSVVTGAMGGLTAYMGARDALQGAGVLKPDYDEYEHMTYHFVDKDGSEFIVVPGGWFSSPKREFVDGPRKGTSETITNDDVEKYRKQAEDEWGKYIPGSLLRDPRFIPGKRRNSLPLIIEKHGVPYDAGWIDEEGVHRYSKPMPGAI